MSLRRTFAILSLSAVLAARAAPLDVQGDGQPRDWTFDSNGHYTATTSTNRTYLIHIPSDYSKPGSGPHPLVFSFHGATRDSQWQEDLTGFSDDGLKIGGKTLVAVYPQGLHGLDGRTAWQSAPYAKSGVNDIGFTQTMLKDIQSHLYIDKTRIFVTGQSNGGGFTNLLACTPSVASHIAAFAAGSAALYPDSLSFSGCRVPSGRSGIPFLETHGLNDTTIPYIGRNSTESDGAAGATPDIDHWRAAWAERNGCKGSTGWHGVPGAEQDHDLGLKPTDASHPFDRTTLDVWKCPKGIEVRGYSILGLGHSWVTGSPFQASTDAIIPFFDKYHL